MKIVFIGYNYLPEYTTPELWINRIKPSLVIMEALSQDNSVSYIGQIGYEGNYPCRGVQYYFFDSKRKKLFPCQLHSFVKKLKPDIVVVPGFHFPIQVIQLRLSLGKKVKIILEHHADKPLNGLKRFFQRMADKGIDSYHFTSLGNAKEWLDARIIKNDKKCYEIPANSSSFSRLDKQQCKQSIGMIEASNFLGGKAGSE